MHRYLKYLSSYMENKGLHHITREELVNLQLKKFRELVKYALTYSPFYQDLYKQANITLSDVEILYPKDVPIVSKKILMSHFDEVVTDQKLKYKKVCNFLSGSENCQDMYEQKYYIINTSGTSGLLGVYPFSIEEYDQMRIFSLTHIVKLSLGNLFEQVINKHKYAFIGFTQGHMAGITMISSLPRLLYELQTISILNPMSETRELLNSFQPDTLAGYASSVARLAEEQLAGRLHIRPKRVFCSGDALYPSLRSLIESAFGVSPLNVYACTEAPNLGWQDGNTDEFFLADHMYHVDLIDNKMCLTNLYLYTFPIIHYQTDDVIEVVDTSYQANPFSKIKLKNVRLLDFIKIINNQGDVDIIHPLTLLGMFAESADLIQFWQKPNNTILIKVKGQGDDLTVRVKSQMLKILQAQKADKVVHLEIERVDDIPINPQTGKFKFINAA